MAVSLREQQTSQHRNYLYIYTELIKNTLHVTHGTCDQDLMILQTQNFITQSQP